MCIVIAVILGIFSFNALMADNYSVGLLSAAGSVFFIALMVYNILHVRKLKSSEKQHMDEKDS